MDRGVSLLLVGPLDPKFEPTRLRALLAREDVQWVGPQPFERLPGYMALIDVGLVPYTSSAFNLSSFPLKTLEYLSAGLPVVSTNLPATRWLDTKLVDIAADPDSFGAVAARLAQSRWNADLIDDRRSFAAQHDWSERAAAWADLLGIPKGMGSSS